MVQGHASLKADNLKKQCTSQAQQIVRRCNNGLNVNEPKAISLITSLTALLLQVTPYLTLSQEVLFRSETLDSTP